MIKTGDFIIYYKKGGKENLSSPFKNICADLKSLLSRRCRRTALGPVLGRVAGPRALSDALAVRFGTTPLTIKYIWSPRVLGEATAGLSGVAPRPCLLGPMACVAGQAALGKGGPGSSLHLRHFRFRKGTVALPSGGGWELPPPCPQHSVPCTAGASLGLLLPDHPEPTGGGPMGQRV